MISSERLPPTASPTSSQASSLLHLPLAQSLGSMHPFVASHLLGQVPPQSMSVSLPFFTLSLQVGAASFCTVVAIGGGRERVSQSCTGLIHFPAGLAVYVAWYVPRSPALQARSLAPPSCLLTLLRA
jgi:hypothetical protein